MTSSHDTRLESGWYPDTPVGDTLLRRFTLNLAESYAGPVAAMGGRVRRDERMVLCDLDRPAALFSSATLLQPLTGEGAGDTLEEIEAFYDGGSGGTAFLFSPWPTPDLSGRGWHLEGHPPMLLRPSGEPAAPPPPHGLRVVEAHGAAAVRDWGLVAVRGFPFEEVSEHAFVDARALADERLRMWVGYEGDEPVTIGTLYVEHGLAQPMLGVSLPSARRRGYWEALMRLRLAAAPTLPHAGLFSDFSRPGAERLGFLPVTRFTLWTRPGAGRRD